MQEMNIITKISCYFSTV